MGAGNSRNLQNGLIKSIHRHLVLPFLLALVFPLLPVTEPEILTLQAGVC